MPLATTKQEKIILAVLAALIVLGLLGASCLHPVSCRGCMLLPEPGQIKSFGIFPLPGAYQI